MNIDTTVQEKDIRFPTDARSYDRARQRLVKAAKLRDVALRQSDNRLSKQMLAQQSRYAFGCKVSVAATSRGGWFVGAKALHGNPYDGHLLT